MNRTRLIAQNILRCCRFYRILSTTKSFEGASPVGFRILNRMGLHRWRVKTASRMASYRRARLSRHVPKEFREEFTRNGFVTIQNVLPDEEFTALKQAIEATSWPSRQMVQGDTITRRVAINRHVLEKVQPLQKLLRQGWLKAAFRYVSSFNIEPLFYIQSIIKQAKGGADPQTCMHADTFHPSMKAWFFLNDVKSGEGAFTYVRGSHQLTPERLAWEHAKALTLPDAGDRMSRRGSFRIDVEELSSLGLPAPEEVTCPANTLVIADTFGFHGRGPSGPDLNRVEIWAYSRRNPFLPYVGGDLFSLPLFSSRRVDWLWWFRDRFPRTLKQPWKKVGNKDISVTRAKISHP